MKEDCTRLGERNNLYSLVKMKFEDSIPQRISVYNFNLKRGTKIPMTHKSELLA